MSFLIPLTVTSHTASAATTIAVQQMAEILLAMETKPNKPQHDVLKLIASGTNVTENEQNLAKAMLNINGTITAEDKQMVWSVLRGISASEGERELAKIINRFDEKASKSDQGRLTRLLPPTKSNKEVAARASKKEQNSDKAPDKNKEQ